MGGARGQGELGAGRGAPGPRGQRGGGEGGKKEGRKEGRKELAAAGAMVSGEREAGPGRGGRCEACAAARPGAGWGSRTGRRGCPAELGV